MAETRLRIQKDLEKSALSGAVLVTDSATEAAYLPRGSAGQVLTMVGTAPTWQTPVTGSAFNLTDGTNTQVINAGDSMLAAAGNGMTVAVGATDRVTYTLRLSAVAGNAATFGADNGLYVPMANVLVSAVWDDATNTLILTFADSSVVNIPILDAVGAFLADFTVSNGTANDLINNHETLTFTGGNNITVGIPGGNIVTVGLNTTGSTAGQVLTSQGTGVPAVWAPVAGAVPAPRKDEFQPLSGTSTVTLTATPSVVTNYTAVDVYRNGLLQQATQYSRTGVTVTMATPFGASTGAVFSETVTVKYYV